jgi:hypothetical protein
VRDGARVLDAQQVERSQCAGGGDGGIAMAESVI